MIFLSDLKVGQKVTYKDCKSQITSLDSKYQQVCLKNLERPKGNWVTARVNLSDVTV